MKKLLSISFPICFTLSVALICNSLLLFPQVEHHFHDIISILLSLMLLVLICISKFLYEKYDVRIKREADAQLQHERALFREALLHDADYSYTFDVNKGIIYDLKSKGDEPLIRKRLPISYDQILKELIQREHPIIIYGNPEHHSIAEYRRAFAQGKRFLEVEYRVPRTDRYQRKSVFLSSDETTGHVLACVVIRDVTELRKEEIANQRALSSLTAAAKQIAQGNLDVEIDDCNAQGDISILVDALRLTISELKVRISHFYDLAYTDQVTGMRNKAAHVQDVEKLDDQLLTNHAVRFAVVSINLNDLGLVNRSLGREMGDLYLITAARHIREVFFEAALYHMGSDEFLAILEAHQLDQVHNLIAELEQNLSAYNNCSDFPNGVTIGIGYAVYDPDTDTCYADVQSRADVLMHKDKQHKKLSLPATAYERTPPPQDTK